MTFARTQLTGVWTAGGYALQPSDMTDLDEKQASMINGDQGGMWAPSSAISLGSSGLNLTGPLSLARGGSLQTVAASGARVRLSGSVWPTLAAGHTGRVRKLISHPNLLTRTDYLMAFLGLGYAQTTALSIRLGSDIITRPELVIPLRVHNGAAFRKVTVNFRVPQRRTSKPLLPPKFRVVKLSKDTGSLSPLKTTEDGTGYVSPINTQDAASWHLDGAAQSFDYTLDAGVTVDIENEAYFLQIIEERAFDDRSAVPDGVLLREQKPDAAALFETNQIVLSGVPGGMSSGGVALLVGQTDGRENGLWIVSAGAWVRPAYADDTGDFTRNFIVRVGFNGGTTNQVYQYSTPQPVSFSAAVTSIASLPLTFEPLKPSGNIYYGPVGEFELSDLRFQ
jgi:hypothetical protein